MKRLYFDYAASTPVDPDVARTISFSLKNKFGNPGSLHYFGQEAMAEIDKSRETIARTIGAEFREIIFTGSATEANNLALRGAIKFFSANALAGHSSQQPVFGRKILPLRIIISAVEHESILETAEDLKKEGLPAGRQGIEIVYLPVDKNGIIDLKKLEKYLNERTIVVSVMYANNETGIIQPIAKISEIIKNFREKHRSEPHTPNPIPYFHTDAVQAFQYLDCDVCELGVDLMTISAHKIYGPKGIGLLYIKNNKLSPGDYRLRPIITGGNQEFGLRSGTENPSLIAGFAKATELVVKKRNSEKNRIKKISEYFLKEIKKIIPVAELNSVKAERLPNILNINFGGYDGEDLIIKFDLAGIAISRGSACLSRASEPSHVLKAMGINDKKIKSSLRFSFGRFTKKSELDFAIKRIKIIFKK